MPGISTSPPPPTDYKGQRQQEIEFGDQHARGFGTLKEIGPSPGENRTNIIENCIKK